MSTIEETKDRILRLLEEGRMAEARPLCQAWLDRSDDAHAWRIMGVIAGREGDHPGAERCFREAMVRDPVDAKAISNFAHTLRAQGNLAEAAVAFRSALALEDSARLRFTLADVLIDLGDIPAAEIEIRSGLALAPDDVPACYTLGWVCHQQGKLKEARDWYKQVLVRDSRHALAMNNLGLLFLADEEYDKARGLLESALAQQPDLAPAWRNLGQTLTAVGQLDEAVTALERALHLGSDPAEAWIDIGRIRAGQKRNREAAEYFEKALRFKPATDASTPLSYFRYIEDFPDIALVACENVLATDPGSAEAHHYKGLALLTLNRLDEAEQSCLQAVSLRPEYAESLASLGRLHQKRDRLQRAEIYYRQALTIRPDYTSARLKLGSVFRDAGRIEEALEWLNNEESLDLRLFTLNYSDATRETIAGTHRVWGERWGYARADLGLPGNNPDPDRRLRIAYLSPDLRNHSVAYFIEPVLQHRDKTRFEVFAYAQFKEAKPDHVSKRLRGYCDHWIETQEFADIELARRIRADGIDILTDLAGHTADNRLLALAYRPAPVQITYLGYPNTTGLSAMDYRLTDECADPAGHEAFHTEQLVRLPHGFLCYSHGSNTEAVAELPALRTGYVTFGSFNNFSKVSPATLKVWANLLHALPNARLILKNKSLCDPDTAQHCMARFAAQGVDPGRLDLIGRLPTRGEHLEHYSRIDIALDTFPYNGTTTTCEALWMGVPVITLAGNRHAGRVGVSLLSRAGLTELIAHNPEEYVKLAVELAQGIERLRRLRAGLRERLKCSPLCDAAAFTAELERAYRELWIKWCERN